MSLIIVNIKKEKVSLIIMSRLPPDPIYIFRGHNSVINTVKILKDIIISGYFIINTFIILFKLKYYNI